MMKKFKRSDNKIKFIIYIIIIILYMYLFTLYFIKSNALSYVVNKINNYYSNKSVIGNIMVEDIASSFNNAINYDNLSININDSKQETETNTLVYIYNTHQTEKYYSPFISDYSITPDVKIASYILKDYLNDYGINSYVETRSMKSYLDKNNLEYKNSYEASRYYMKNKIKEYDFKYFIDIHRDSSNISKTLYKLNDKRYARIMFVVGMNHKNSNKNLKVVEKINNMINNSYNGLSRGIYKRSDARFNQDISNNAMLIELGGVDNTLEEINNTLEILSKILYEYIIKETNGN